MGDMAEYYDERTDDDYDDWRDPPREYRAVDLGMKRRADGRWDTTATHCHPSSDEDAQALIESLGTYVWETRKVDGRYTAEPYTLHATINDHAYVIHLPGRFGSTLRWLKRKVGAA